MHILSVSGTQNARRNSQYECVYSGWQNSKRGAFIMSVTLLQHRFRLSICFELHDCNFWSIWITFCNAFWNRKKEYIWRLEKSAVLPQLSFPVSVTWCIMGIGSKHSPSTVCGGSNSQLRVYAVAMSIILTRSLAISGRPCDAKTCQG